MSNLLRDQRLPTALTYEDVLALGVPAHILHALSALQTPLPAVSAPHPVTGPSAYNVRATEAHHGTA